MDDLLAPLQDLFEGQIDFHGQRLAEILCTFLLILSGTIGFITGYIYKDIHLTLWTTLAGTLLTALVVVPPWPVYNKHPERWLSSLQTSGGRMASGGSGGKGIVVDGVRVAVH